MGSKKRRRLAERRGERAAAPRPWNATWRQAMEEGRGLDSRGRHAEAVERFGEAMELGGGGDADLHASMGEALQGLGRSEEALAHFEKGIEADPRHTISLFKKAEALLALNRVDEAREWCGRAIESDPDECPPHHVMGNVHARLHDVEAAIAEYAEAVRIDPTSFRSYANMGISHIKAGRPAEALQCIDSALKINPKYAYAHALRCSALKELGRKSEARRSWEKATRYDPRYMLGDASVHLRADKQAEQNRAGWDSGRPPKGLGRIRLPKGRKKARSKKRREGDIALAKLRAACELEGISVSDAILAIMLNKEEGGGSRASIVDRVREMRAGEEGGPRPDRGGGGGWAREQQGWGRGRTGTKKGRRGRGRPDRGGREPT